MRKRTQADASASGLLTHNVDWSIDGQTPEFLAATRMISLARPIVRSILNDLQLKPGMKVLDVGCGSGEYCFRLGSAVEGVAFTGLEYDPHFVEFANARARGEIGYPFEKPNPANEYRFICGDGLDLPFDDGAFDAVISHTYLTALPDWACALAEMCRVCKPGGTVSSVTSLTDDFYGTGTIELFSGLLQGEDAAVMARIDNAKGRVFANMPLAPGIAPRKAPVAFDWIGLHDVRCTPLGQYFCLSDANVDPDDYVRYVDLLCEMERKQLLRLEKELPAIQGSPTDASSAIQGTPADAPPSGAADAPSEEDLARYRELIEERREFLIGSLGCNREWSWFGNASLLVSGTVPDGGLAEQLRPLRDSNRKARHMVGICEQLGMRPNFLTTQLGCGRCVKVETSTDTDGPFITYGFDPPSAMQEACAKLIARTFSDDARSQDDYERMLADGKPQSQTEDIATLVGEEQRFESLEKQLVEALSAGALSAEGLSDYPAERVFESAAMWETTSEAALAGISAHFKDASSGCEDLLGHACAVMCLMSSEGRAAKGLSVHDDFELAAQRAFARALGELRPRGATPA